MIQISRKNMTVTKQLISRCKSSVGSYRRQCGAAMSEFLIAIPALLFLGLGAMQLALMYNAKTTVTYAAFEATRVGAVSHAQAGPMREEFGTRIAPIFGGDGSPELASAAIARGLLEANDSRYTRVEILSPTQEAFADFGVQNAGGVTEIPNTHLRGRPRDLGATSGVNIQDANLLKVKITYAYDLKVPLMDRVIPAVMRQLDSANARYYTLGRIPVSAVSTVRMQSPARESDNASFNGGNSGGGTLPPGDPGDGGGGDPTDPPPGDGGGNDDNSGDEDTTDPTSPSCDPAVQDCIGDSDEDSDPSLEEETRPECVSRWSDEEFNQANDTILGVEVPFTGTIRSATAAVTAFAQGLIDGLVGQVTGIIDLVTSVLRDPQVVVRLAEQIYEQGFDFLRQLALGIVEDVRTVVECGPTDIGQVVGENLDPTRFLGRLGRMINVDLLARYGDDIPRDRGDNNTNPDNDGNGPACTLRRSSFTEGTLVWTLNGKSKIEDIAVGDIVQSRGKGFYDKPQKVIDLHTRVAPGYYVIKTELGATVNATKEHPFWVQGKGWTAAEDIEQEDVVATFDGDVLVTGVEQKRGDVRVYNFSVDNTPSYFVSESGLWVHNQPRDCDNDNDDNLSDEAREFAARALRVQRLMAQTAQEVRNDWVRDPQQFLDRLSAGERRALRENPALTSRFFGTHLEIEMNARLARSNPDLADLNWTGRGSSPYDWSINAPDGTRHTYDVTGGSQSSIMVHTNRDGIDTVITYDSVPGSFYGDVQTILRQ